MQMHFGLQETHVIGSFLGANVAVYYCSVRVQFGVESWVIAPNGAHRARTVHPFPLWALSSAQEPDLHHLVLQHFHSIILPTPLRNINILHMDAVPIHRCTML